LFAVRSLGAVPASAKQSGPAPQSPTASISGTISVVTGEGAKNSLAGVNVKLTGPAPSTTSQTAATNSDGRYEFTHLSAGSYTLEATVQGFNPWTSTVAVESGQMAVADGVLQISTVNEKVEVQGEATEVATQSVSASATVSEKELEALPLKTAAFTEALSASPSVIKTQEGKLNFNGQAESQGLLLVDSAENVDPVSGSFAIPIPVDAIQSIQVFSTPDSAEYGGFSGGLTRIELKPPPDSWISKLHNFIPSFRAKNGHLVGLANITPRLEFGGPIIKDKFTYFEEMTYTYRRDPVRGLTWPYNETYVRSFNSLTNFQYTFSPKHLFSVNINIFPSNNDFVNIDALIPQSASANYRRRGVSTGVSDFYQFDSGVVLDTVVRYTYFNSKTYGQGMGDMTISPSGWGGNFFNTWVRTANQIEAIPTIQLPGKSFYGRHELKFGTDFIYRSYNGNSASRPIHVEDQTGLPTELITFQGPGLLQASSAEVSEFVQDNWTLDTHLSLNFGGRLTSQSIGRDIAFAPRAGFAFTPGSGKTVIRAGVGLVYGHVPLLAADYANNQVRQISYYNSSGMLVGQPIILQNIYLPGGLNSTAPGGSDPGTSPRTFTWNVEGERAVRKDLIVRLGYIETHTTSLFVIDPILPVSGNIGTMALLNTGSSHFRKAEVSTRYRFNEIAEVNASFAWSRARGDINALSDNYVPFQSPIIRPNAYGVMPSDIPYRFLASGYVHLPWKMVVSPVLDWHTGYPYSNVDVLQNYVGQPNSLRFPNYFSLDGKIYKNFSVHIPFKEPTKRIKLRIGVYALDFTNRHNPHDVFNNTGLTTSTLGSPVFGQFSGFQRRFTGAELGLGE
jgi:hypothetical protein